MRTVPGWLRRRRIGVLCGGLSEEREISLRTGAAVFRGLRALGLDAVRIDAGRDLPARLARGRIDFCFNALHGKIGEDGTVQGLCEVMGIPYTGSGVLASALAMDKPSAKRVLIQAGIPTAPFEVLEGGEAGKWRMPCVVKPVDGGSAIGVSIVHRKRELSRAVRRARRYSRRVLVESFVSGKEVTASILGSRVLPLIEIVPKGDFYDFRAKYVPGMSDHILPARLSRRSAGLVRDYALRAHRALGCRAYSRADFIVDASGRPQFLELNTVPGMTETSLFPEAARAAGIGFELLLLEIIRLSAGSRGR